MTFQASAVIIHKESNISAYFHLRYKRKISGKLMHRDYWYKLHYVIKKTMFHSDNKSDGMWVGMALLRRSMSCFLHLPQLQQRLSLKQKNIPISQMCHERHLLSL